MEISVSCNRRNLIIWVWLRYKAVRTLPGSGCFACGLTQPTARLAFRTLNISDEFHSVEDNMKKLSPIPESISN